MPIDFEPNEIKQEQVEKLEAAYREANYGNVGRAETASPDKDYKPKKQSLLSRLTEEHHECLKASGRAYKYDELIILLRKNPEVARILELLEQLQ
jgi:hypothetical protein